MHEERAWVGSSSLSLVAFLLLAASGCATTFSPRPPGEVLYKLRAQEQAQVGLTVTVTAAVPAQPHIVRLWLVPFRFQGKHVWVGQVSTPLGGRFAEATPDGADPLMAPDVDEARNDLIQDWVYSQSLTKLGYVTGVGRVRVSAPRTTPNGGTYYTDGLRAVLLFEQGHVSLSDLGFFEWERLVARATD